MYMTKLMFKQFEALIAGGSSLLGAGVVAAPAFGSVAALQAGAATGFLGLSAGTLSTLSTISSIMGGIGSIKAGREADKAYKLQAEQVEAAEKDEETKRLRSLRMAQSSQRAYWGSRGVSAYTGSAATIAQQSRVSYTRESEAGAYSTGREIQRLGAKGASAKTASYFNAIKPLIK